ncbi:MAG: YceI family protein [Syntrophobacteraceae bacterium]
MRTRIMPALTIAFLLLLPLTAVAADSYRIDPAHSSLTFFVRHMGISNVRGHFDKFDGSILLDKGEVREASGTIQTGSINTGVLKRDDHLRTADFFDASTYPVITFKTRKVEKAEGKTFLIADFTMRGVTRELRLPITLSGPIKDPQGNIRIGIEAEIDINRRDYGINYSGNLENGAALVGEKVSLVINAEAIKETPGQAAGK